MSVDSSSILALADRICELSLIEVVQLNELLKDKLKISDSDFGVAMPVAASSAASANAPAADAKTEFTIVVSKHPADVKTKLIKLVKEVKEVETGSAVGLMDVKKMVDSLPLVLCEKVNKEKLDKYSAMLKEIGVDFTVE